MSHTYYVLSPDKKSVKELGRDFTLYDLHLSAGELLISDESLAERIMESGQDVLVTHVNGFPLPAPFLHAQTRQPHLLPKKHLEAPPEPKFLRGDHVRHVKTGGVYAIRWSPADNFVIEATVEPAYVYESVLPHQNTRWIRPQSEMEDGRFVLAGGTA